MNIKTWISTNANPAWSVSSMIDDLHQTKFPRSVCPDNWYESMFSVSDLREIVTEVARLKGLRLSPTSRRSELVAQIEELEAM